MLTCVIEHLKKLITVPCVQIKQFLLIIPTPSQNLSGQCFLLVKKLSHELQQQQMPKAPPFLSPDSAFSTEQGQNSHPFCTSKIICQTRALWPWYSSQASHTCTSNSQGVRRWNKRRTHWVVQVNAPLNKSSSHSPGHSKQYELHLLWISSYPSSQVQTDKQNANLFFFPRNGWN